MVSFTTAIFQAYDGEEPYEMYAVIPDDLTNGFIIGEWSGVEALHEALTRLIDTRQADEQIDELDERLGHVWLSVSDAARKFDVPVPTVRHAASQGHIPMATKNGRDWRFPQRKFLYWLSEIYQPRR